MNTFTMSIGLQKKAMLRHFDEMQVERWLKEAKIVQKALLAASRYRRQEKQDAIVHEYICHHYADSDRAQA